MTLRFKLRTLLILLPLGPPALAVSYFCWQPPHNFDIFELRALSLAIILAGVALAVGHAVFWKWRWGSRPT